MKRSRTKDEGHGALIFAFIAISGIALLVMLGPSLWKHTRTGWWPEVSATVLSSELHSDNGEPSIVVRYRYEFAGQPHIGNRFALNGNDMDGPAHARQVLNRFQAGNVVPCFVDPSDPTTSILEPSSIVESLMLIAAIAASGLGIGGFLFALRANRRSDHAAVASSDLASFRIFLLIFIFFGGIGIMGLVIVPCFQMLNSNDWREEPCTIVASSVLHRRTAKGGSSYRFDIAYEYTVNGQVHVGTRYTFGVSGTGSFAGMSSLTATHPEGSKTVCRVNPKDPTDAVLVRKLEIGWVALVPGLFLVVGTAILITAGPRVSKKQKSSLVKRVKESAA